MTIRLPNGLDDLNLLVGSAFPEADEDALRRLAATWAGIAARLRDLQPDGDRLGAAVVAAVDQTMGDTFQRAWQQLVGSSQALLPGLAKVCDDIAAACEHAAREVEYAKLQYIAALVVLAVSIAALLATAVLGGVSAAGIPIAVAGAQVTIRLLLVRLVTAVVVSTAFTAGLDAIAQGVQFLEGHRGSWDWSKTRRAAEDGVIFGAIGGAVFAGASRLLPRAMGTVGGVVGAAGVTGALGGVTAPLVHGEDPSGADVLTALVSGAAGGLGPDLHYRPGRDPALETSGAAAQLPHLDGVFARPELDPLGWRPDPKLFAAGPGTGEPGTPGPARETHRGEGPPELAGNRMPSDLVRGDLVRGDLVPGDPIASGMRQPAEGPEVAQSVVDPANPSTGPLHTGSSRPGTAHGGVGGGGTAWGGAVPPTGPAGSAASGAGAAPAGVPQPPTGSVAESARPAPATSGGSGAVGSGAVGSGAVGSGAAGTAPVPAPPTSHPAAPPTSHPSAPPVQPAGPGSAAAAASPGPAVEGAAVVAAGSSPPGLGHTPLDQSRPGHPAPGHPAQDSPASDSHLGQPEGEPGVAVAVLSDPAAIDLARRHAFRTPAGLAFYPVGDEVRAFAAAIRPTPGYLTLDLHGSRTGFVIDDQRLSPRQLALALRELQAAGELDLPPDAGIKLVSCDTAYGGETSVAAQLARELGVAVIAPDQPVWTAMDGQEIVSSPVPFGGAFVPGYPPDGQWHRFSPAGSETPLDVPVGYPGDAVQSLLDSGFGDRGRAGQVAPPSGGRRSDQSPPHRTDHLRHVGQVELGPTTQVRVGSQQLPQLGLDRGRTLGRGGDDV